MHTSSWPRMQNLRGRHGFDPGSPEASAFSHLHGPSQKTRPSQPVCSPSANDTPVGTCGHQITQLHHSITPTHTTSHTRSVPSDDVLGNPVVTGVPPPWSPLGSARTVFRLEHRAQEFQGLHRRRTPLETSLAIDQARPPTGPMRLGGNEMERGTSQEEYGVHEKIIKDVS